MKPQRFKVYQVVPDEPGTVIEFDPERLESAMKEHMKATSEQNKRMLPSGTYRQLMTLPINKCK